jgi:superfamily II DNA/RNA helicase
VTSAQTKTFGGASSWSEPVGLPLDTRGFVDVLDIYEAAAQMVAFLVPLIARRPHVVHHGRACCRRLREGPNRRQAFTRTCFREVPISLGVFSQNISELKVSGVTPHEYVTDGSSANKAGVLTGGEHTAPFPFTSSDSQPTFANTFPGRIPKWLELRLSDLGFSTPTTVQLRALDVALPGLNADAGVLGQDVVIHAQTGCGKTLAYLLPAITAVDPTRACVQAAIVVPTQELGMQVYKTLRRLTVAWPHPAEESIASDATCDLYDTEPDNFDESRELLLEESYFDDMEDDDVGIGSGCSANDSKTSMEQMEPNQGNRGFPVLPMLNQADLRRQKLQLRKTAPRIIVGNPHRIAALVESGRLRLDLLRVLVVDEFDACLLDTSTTSALQTVLAVRGRERRQTILASATVPQHRHFLRQCVRQRWTTPDIEHIWIEEGTGVCTPITIQHAYALCNGRKKLSALRALLERFGHPSVSGPLPPCSIVFVMPSRSVEHIVNALNAAFPQTAGGDEAVVGLWNDVPVFDRRRSMRRFRSGQARVLVATDVAARGLDIPAVSHVFHLDLPVDADAYLHRAGRAGRLGREGMSVALVTSGEEFVIRRTANSLGIQFDRVGGNSLQE